MNTYLLIFTDIASAVVGLVAGWMISRHIGRGKVTDQKKQRKKFSSTPKKRPIISRKRKRSKPRMRYSSYVRTLKMRSSCAAAICKRRKTSSQHAN